MLRRAAPRTPVEIQRGVQNRNAWATALVAAGASVVVAGAMLVRGVPVGPTFIVFTGLVLGAVVAPRATLGVSIVFAMAGDARSMPWWPYVKNLSSEESVAYVSDALVITPIEIVLSTMLVAWFVQRAVSSERPSLDLGVLWRPVVIFGISIVTGFLWGITRNGDFRIAVFEARGLLYIPIVYFLVSVTFTEFRHYRRVLWGISAALAFEAVYALARMEEIRTRIPERQSPIEHTAAVHANLLILFLLASWWLGSSRPLRRTMLGVLLVPTLLIYLASERRAAMIGAIAGVIYLAIVLFNHNRGRFFRVIPAMFTVGIGYVGAFWNAGGQLGFPAQAVKTVIAPGQTSQEDAQSNIYRVIENFDLWVTVRAEPFLGIGFGQRFYRPVPLPDTSFFEFNEYLPHNSVLWVWLKVGIIGFLAFLYLFSTATFLGIRGALQATGVEDRTTVAVIGAYIPMTMVVSYVDITFDPQTTTLLGMAFALVASAHRLVPTEPPPDRDPPPRTTVLAVRAPEPAVAR